jgi:ATP-binding cassette subfamily B protein
LYQTHFWIWIIYDYSFFITLILNFFFLVKGKNEGWITIGDFILVTRITLGVVEFLWKFTREFAKFTKSLGSINNALETIQLIEDFLQTSQKALLQIQKGEIIFQEVSFHYSESESLFENLELKIPGGQKIGIVGYSGAGKTSLANRLLRLFDPVRGAVLIDNQDIRTISDESFYAAVTTIPQEPILFHRSIYENIAYGSSDVTKEQVIQAAQNAYIHDFISLLRDGYDTLVGERGVKLSGGQKQRIVIARAFLKNSPILILDEATSQIDTLTEKTIQASLKKLFQSKTVIVIAHRISTLHLMDRVIVLDAGRVVGDGTHGDLLKQCELYAKLWKNQFKGFFP